MSQSQKDAYDLEYWGIDASRHRKQYAENRHPKFVKGASVMWRIDPHSESCPAKIDKVYNDHGIFTYCVVIEPFLAGSKQFVNLQSKHETNSGSFAEPGRLQTKQPEAIDYERGQYNCMLHDESCKTHKGDRVLYTLQSFLDFNPYGFNSFIGDTYKKGIVEDVCELNKSERYSNIECGRFGPEDDKAYLISLDPVYADDNMIRMLEHQDIVRGYNTDILAQAPWSREFYARNTRYFK